LYECLQVEGYVGGYSAVQRFVKAWKQSRASTPSINDGATLNRTQFLKYPKKIVIQNEQRKPQYIQQNLESRQSN
jgi:hypothetical protein